MAITNKDIFEEFTRRIREENATDEELMQDYGGTPIYVPSYKRNGRDGCIIKDYLENKRSVKELARIYDLSERRVYEILEPVREPSLF